MQSKNVNLRETLDPKRMEQVNLNDPDELEAQLELLDVVRSRRPESPKRSPAWRLVCCRFFVCVLVLVPLIAAVLVDHLRRENVASSENIVPLPRAPANLASTCSAKSIMDEVGLEACKHACEVSECCDFPANMALSCLTGNEKKCLEYHASCSILVKAKVEATVPENIPPAPANIWEVCEPASLLTPDGFTSCHTACEPAQCCYESDVSPSCNEVHEECQEYAPCLNLAATNHIHEDIVTEVQAKCSSDSIRSLEGRNECKEACSHARCCFATDENPEIKPCLHENTDWCLQYEACSATLVEDADSMETQQDTKEPVDAAQIKQACVGSPQPALCLELCEPGDCCFRHHGCDRSTHDMEHCVKYASCFVNYGETDDDDVVTTEGDLDVNMEMLNTDAVAIAEACHDSTATDVGQKCASMCEASKCCFEKQYCDENTQDMNCDKYASCYVLYEAPEVDDTTTEKAALDENVEVDAIGEYNDMNYGVDDNLKAPGGAAAAAAIVEACNGSTQQDVDPQCETLCEPAKCCFVHHNCNGMTDNISCDDYAICSVLYGVTDDDDVV